MENHNGSAPSTEYQIGIRPVTSSFGRPRDSSRPLSEGVMEAIAATAATPEQGVLIRLNGVKWSSLRTRVSKSMRERGLKGHVVRVTPEVASCWAEPLARSRDAEEPAILSAEEAAVLMQTQLAAGAPADTTRAASAYRRQLDDIDARLARLGYDADGNPLPPENGTSTA